MNVADDVRKRITNNADPSVAAGFASSTHPADAEAAQAESAQPTHTAQNGQTAHDANTASPSVTPHSVEPAQPARTTRTRQARLLSPKTAPSRPLKPNSESSDKSNGKSRKIAKRSAKPEKYARGTRSYTMSHIRGKDTSIEVAVRSYLFRRGLRFRKNDKRYPGHPDVVLPKYHTIVFINGCFWHAHKDCPKYSMPKSNVEFWTAKLTRNRERDARQHAELEAAGWRVIVVWECELGKAAREERLARLYEQIMGDASMG